MSDPTRESSRLIRFGVFEADLAARTLRKAGARIRLQEQPFRVLAMLLARPGEVVTREELQQELWPDAEYGEFDLGLNTAVRKLRQALNDSADSPRWIETVPKVGYKFLGPVEAGLINAGEPSASPPHATPPRLPFPAVPWALVAGLAVILGLVLSWPADPVSAPVVDTLISTPVELGEVAALALSPDGAWLAIAGRSRDGPRLWLRALDEDAVRVLPGTEGAEYPFWSPDSASIGFFADSQLKRIEVDGGAPVIVCDVAEPRGGAWSEDGVILYGSWQGPIFRVAVSGGTPVAVTDQALGEPPHTHRWPVFLPNGRRFLFHSGQTGAMNDQDGRLYLGSLDADTLVDVMRPSPGSAAYSNGRLLSVSNGTLLARRLNIETGALEEKSAVVAEGVGFLGGLSRAQFSVSRGALAFLTNSGPLRELVRYNREGNRLGTVGEPGYVRLPSFSPDGERLMFNKRGEIWVHDLSRNVGSRVSNAGRIETPGFWSGQGDRILVQTSEGVPGVSPGFSFAVHPADGSGEAKVIFRSADDEYGWLTDWSRDGRYLLFQAGTPGEPQQPWALRLDDEGEVEERIPLGSGGGAVLSPDGEWVAYRSSPVRGDSAAQAVYVAAFPDSTGRVRVSPGSGIDPRWGPDGRELFYFDQDLFLNVAEIERDSSGQARVRSNKRLFSRRGVFEGVGDAGRLAVAPDGQSFVLVEPASNNARSEIRLIWNWPERVAP